ncbi:tetratricopeptide repeat protein [Novosphingobium sp. M1R2S20]|uniref:Tetratricopeptide repeat protein n=1 Tax=Novosphingobium rhizovicinum TaxID=3228928 RepID=A0ABV3RBI9_9SPHN
MPLAAALVCAVMPFAGHAEEDSAAALLVDGREALARADGIAAEAKLRAALDQGVPKERVAAPLGAAYLQQGDLTRARGWLAPGMFSPETAAEGFRLLARLEQTEGNLPAAGAAYDRALALTPRDAELWVEIGRLRHRGGEDELARQAAEHALSLDGGNVRAQGFQGELIREREGLTAALPWFERGLQQAPDDVPLLLEYAATLGELGRGKEMLEATRQVLKLDPGNARAYYLQAVLAARAGRYELSRSLLARTEGKLAESPGLLLLRSVLELAAGNTRSASDLCERLLHQQPSNVHAQRILARAIFLSGQYRYLALRFRDEVARPDASPYVLTIVARGYEALSDRVRAGELLDRAASPQSVSLRIVGTAGEVGSLMAQGHSLEAEQTAERARMAAPGSYASQSIAGDVQLALGRSVAAQERYARAGSIRMSESLLLRRFRAYAAAGELSAASRMVRTYLSGHPESRGALRLEAGLALGSGDTTRAEAILTHLHRAGGTQDAQLLLDLALVQLRAGDAQKAPRYAAEAYRLQRANPVAAQVLALSYAASGTNRPQAAALLEKAGLMLGDTPLLAQARARLSQAGRS